MQGELRQQFPTQQVDILAINEAGQEGGNDNTTANLPVVQDVNTDGIAGSDAWTAWNATWRDVTILDATNTVTAVYNLTNNNLELPNKYAELKQLFVDALTENARPTAPTGIDLLPEADSGGSNSDNVTNFNNSDAAHALRLSISGVSNGATVNVFAGSTLIGSSVASGSTVTIVTNGTVTLGDGASSLTATQTVGSSTSDASPALAITIDASVPSFTSTAVTQAEVGEAYSYNAQSSEEGNVGLTYLLSSPPAGMTIDQNSGVISWTPTAAQIGNINVVVQAVDAAGNTGTQSFTVAVSSDNDPPVATDDTGATDEDTVLNVAAPGVLSNDTDPDTGTTLTVSAFDATSTRGATVTVGANGSYTYDPRTSAELGNLAEGATLEDTFTYTVSDGEGGTDVATVRITVTGKADAPPPSASVSDVTIAEGNAGTTNLVFTVTLSGAATNVVTINYATANVTATAGADYTSTTGTLTFGIGETSKTISVPILGDTTDELNETFELNLSAPLNATLADSQATGTITDDDAAPTVSIAGTTVTEGDSGTVNATLTVMLSNASSQTVTVAYTTQNGTAIAPGDYTTTSGTLTFAAGETSKTISVPIAVDGATEASETFKVVLSAPTNATLGTAEGTVTITDDDGPGTLQFSAATYNVAEAAGTITITVTRSGGDAAGVTVQYATSNGTATAGSDFTTSSGTLTFAAGETSKTFTVPILVDAVLEQNETFTLSLSAPGGGGTLGTPATATVTITEVQETPEEAVVKQAYEDLLGREAEDAGLQYYADKLEAGTMNEFQMATAMQNSPEYRTRQLQSMYQKYLGRVADAAGLSAHMSYLAAGGTWDGIRATFLSSSEYYRRAGGSGAGFLAALYRDVLGRAIDPVGQQEFGNLLRNENRETVARKLLASDEAYDKKVAAVYDELLERTPSTGEVDFYSSQLARGAREDQIISAFVASPEYDA